MSNFITNTKLADRKVKLNLVPKQNWKGHIPDEEVTAWVDKLPSGGGGDIDVDTALSQTSTNPVENRAVTTKILNVEDKIPTTAQIKKLAKEEARTLVDSAVEELEEKIPTRDDIYEVVDDKIAEVDIPKVISDTLEEYDLVTSEDVDNKISQALDDGLKEIGDIDVDSIWEATN